MAAATAQLVEDVLLVAGSSRPGELALCWLHVVELVRLEQVEFEAVADEGVLQHRQLEDDPRRHAGEDAGVVELEVGEHRVVGHGGREHLQVRHARRPRHVTTHADLWK